MTATQPSKETQHKPSRILDPVYAAMRMVRLPPHLARAIRSYRPQAYGSIVSVGDERLAEVGDGPSPTDINAGDYQITALSWFLDAAASTNPDVFTVWMSWAAQQHHKIIDRVPLGTDEAVAFVTSTQTLHLKLAEIVLDKSHLMVYQKHAIFYYYNVADAPPGWNVEGGALERINLLRSWLICGIMAENKLNLIGETRWNPASHNTVLFERMNELIEAMRILVNMASEG